MLPRDELLKGSRRPNELAALIELAEQALRTWEPCWSGSWKQNCRRTPNNGWAR